MRSWKAGKPAHTLEEMQRIARLRGGQCLAKTYINGRTRLPWRCCRNHEWEANGESVLAGHWCPHCAEERSRRRRRFRGYLKCQTIARERGGRCLSAAYLDSDTPLDWECAGRHQWSTKPANVFSGHWCVICANEKKSRDNTNLAIDDMRRLAAAKGGKCNSLDYRNTYHPLEWECALGHRWSTAPANVIAGRWCPMCRHGLSERICRAVFEHLLDARFPKARPPWLLGKRGKPLELDGYCETLKLAFEYQGAQHFAKVKQFRMDGRRLAALRSRDKLKRAACREHGITLIEIPYTVPHHEIEAHIRSELERTGVTCISWRNRPPVDLHQIAIVTDHRLAQCQAMARAHGGTCESTQYLGQNVELLWRCALGHEWKKSPRLVHRGVWCRACWKAEHLATHHIETLAKIRQCMEKAGGRVESVEFVGQNEPLSLLCRCGCRWSASWASLRHGTACPHCRTKPCRDNR